MIASSFHGPVCFAGFHYAVSSGTIDLSTGVSRRLRPCRFAICPTLACDAVALGNGLVGLSCAQLLYDFEGLRAGPLVDGVGGHFGFLSYVRIGRNAFELYVHIGRISMGVFMFSEIFAVRLREIREVRGFRLKDVAAALGIALRSYQRYEAGERQPDIDSLVALADYFNVSLDYLVGRLDNPKDGIG